MQLAEQEELMGVEERDEISYILENGSNLTILKQFKGNVYRKVMYLDYENVTLEQRQQGSVPRYYFVGEWLPIKAPLFNKKNYRYNKMKDFKQLCEQVEQKLSQVHKLEKNIFFMLTGKQC